jgi:BlaI family transcriptional regulator, penicillinase repressor
MAASAPSPLSELGRRERQIMDVVIRLGRAAAADVRRELPDELSSSTVRTMLRLLEQKGYLRHEWDGPRFVYFPAAHPERLKRSAVRHLMHTFFGNSIEAAVASMLGTARHAVSDEELQRVARLIRRARRRTRGGRSSS